MHRAAFVLVFAGVLLFFFSCTQKQEATGLPQKVAHGDSVMVVTAHPLATAVGVDILRRGGNAADAAVAVQFALAVVYPQAGNIGGGGFLVYRDREGAVAAIDYREKAPAGAFETMYLDGKGDAVPEKSRFGALAAGVPGTVDGMWETHRRFGRLPWDQLVMPAVQLAREGFAITGREANNLNDERANFEKYNLARPVFVQDSAWKAGDRLQQPVLAETLERIAREGRDGFYQGAVAKAIVETMQAAGGMISTDDLVQYRSVWRTPLEFDYRDLHIISMPPPSSGGIILQQLLAMVEPFPLHDYGFHSVAAVHLMAEAERRAYADRAEHHGDPDFWPVPVNTLISRDYLRDRMADFDPAQATPSSAVTAGRIAESEETTHYSIVDAEGNAASVTTTLNDSYGSRLVAPGAGFILNNEMDDFSAKPGAANLYGALGGKANAVAAGKRPLSSMTPTIITRNGRLWMIVGTPGGTTIPTSVFQIIVNVRDFNLPLPEAVSAGRFHHQWQPDAIQPEADALPPAVVDSLQRMGHQFRVRTSPIGRVEAILLLPDGRRQGVADTRGDDDARGY